MIVRDKKGYWSGPMDKWPDGSRFWHFSPYRLVRAHVSYLLNLARGRNKFGVKVKK